MTQPNLTGKTVLITGGTGGIGQETAIGLAKLGAHVVVTGRSQARGVKGVNEIKTLSGSDRVDLMLADLSSQAEVRRLASDFMETYDRLDVLVNNVGYLPPSRTVTEDGIEMTLAVNVLTPFLLTHELLPILQANPPSRVINVTGGQLSGKIDFDNLQAEKSFLGLDTYSHAKRVMMAMSYAFAKRLDGSGVMLNTAYPGPADTDMSRNLSPDMIPWFMRPFWPIVRYFLGNASAERAARSSIYLASAAEVIGTSGKYYDTHSKVASWPSAAIDNGNPERIWKMATQLTQPTPIHATMG